MNDAIENLMKSLNKKFGGNIISALSDLEPIEVIPFGIKSLDEITGIGGVPRGRLTELYGSESSGKSSLCLALVSEAQKLGLKCAYIDMEFSMTKELATKMGVDMESLIYVQPVTGEEALQITEELIESDVKLIIVDSVSSLVPQPESESDFNQSTIGLQARLMSKAMRILTGPVKRNNVALVFVNQIRDDINKMGFGPKTTTSGGRALRFYASLRLKVARKGWITKADQKVGINIICIAEKNKVDRPQLRTEFDFFFETGFDREGDLLSFLLAEESITMIGRTYYHGDKEMGTKDKAIEYIRNNKIE